MSIIQGNAKTGASRGFYPFTIGNSLRFNAGDDPFLSRTPSSAGNRRTWTWSAWVKRGDVSNTDRELFGTAAEGDVLKFSDSRIFWFNNGSSSSYLSTTALFRDPGAWYNIVLSFDTTQSTASDRVKLFVNGTAVAFDNNTTFPSLNYEGDINNTEAQFIGKGHGASEFDGYLAEVILLDGTAVSDASNFGELQNDIWVAKDYSGSYGTNGFRLEFKQSGTGTGSSSTVGADTSGNDNHFTSSGLASTDQVLDSPTDNFCVLNPIELNYVTINEGNLSLTEAGGSTFRSIRGTFMMPTGKWFWEFKATTSNNGFFGGGVSKVSDSTASYVGNTADGNGILAFNGNKYTNDAATSFTSAFGANVVIGVAFDADAGTLIYYKDGSSLGTAFTGLTSGDYFPAFSSRGETFAVNFGQQALYGIDGNGTLPTGYLTLNTSNLPDPSIDPAQDETPDNYFNTVLYTGTGTAIGSGGKAVTGVGFQPDWVWIKNRDATDSHSWYDVVRGVTKQLECDNAAAQSTEAESLTAFGADGFTLGSLAQVNTNTEDYASWSWKAGGSGSTIAAGSIDGTNPTIASTVSASQKAGISIVKWTGNATANATVDHGLDAKPKVAIIKSMDNAVTTWQVSIAAEVDGTAKYIRLDLSDHAYTLAGFLTVIGDQTFTFTGTTDSQRQYNNRAEDYIAYCFTDVEGYSRIGSYTGNNNTDNAFVFTGFRPAWIMIKNIDLSATGSWAIWDTKRNTFNVSNTILSPDTTAIESSTNVTNSIDILSNGFKVRGATSLTGDANNYLYMAFAEQPFKYSNAR